MRYEKLLRLTQKTHKTCTRQDNTQIHDEQRGKDITMSELETNYTVDVSLYFLLRTVTQSDPVSNMRLLSLSVILNTKHDYAQG
jgi:hypothetical protein